MDESRYLDLAKRTFDAVLDAFDEVDADDADIEPLGDVIKIVYPDGMVCVINTQRPARQIWMAAEDRAWHFDWDDESQSWVDDKGTGAELLATIRRVSRDHGIPLPS